MTGGDSVYIVTVDTDDGQLPLDVFATRDLAIAFVEQETVKGGAVLSYSVLVWRVRTSLEANDG